MKISFWIPAIVLYIVRVAFSNSVQVGTVLFTTTDLFKRCWTESDKSLLKARLIMQDVLPDPDCIDFSKPEAGIILLDYFHACYQIIASSTYGKIQNLMYLALSDAVGGYLRAYVLPFTRRAYYAGHIKYSEAKRLFQLYDDIRVFLKTNGLGWAGPPTICYRKIRVKPLTITGGSLEACNQLYTIETESKLHCINPPKNPPSLHADDPNPSFSNSFKEAFREDDPIAPQPRMTAPNFTSPTPHYLDTSHQEPPFHKDAPTAHNFYQDSLPPPSMNATHQTLHDDDRIAKRKTRYCNYFCQRINTVDSDAKRVIVPLPMLDDCCTPNSIAVPFRKRPFRNLAARNSAFILEYYYIAVIKCFIAKGNTRTDIKNFNSQFHAWLVSQVFPHLNDEKWYPAFGGVLRVMETIKKFGAETTVNDPALHDIAYMFEKGVPFDVMDDAEASGREKVRNVKDDDCCAFPNRRYITAVLVMSLIAIFIFCTCLFYCQATRGSYLLYEGCSEASTYSRPKRQTAANNDKFINFQFLVKFFKRNDDFPVEEQVYHCFSENAKRTNVWKSLAGDTKPKFSLDAVQWKEQVKKDPFSGRQPLEGKPKEKGRLTIVGQGNVPSYLLCSAHEHHPLVRPRDCWIPPKIVETELSCQEDGPREREVNAGLEHMQTLWKKPSVRFKRNATLRDGERKEKGRFERTLRGTPRQRQPTTTTSDDLTSKTSSNSCSASMEDETKGSSTEKRSSTRCCGASCQHSNRTSTTSYSRTQVEEKPGSATRRFFQKVTARHKPRRKSSTQWAAPPESTAESDSEGDDSYSSESED